MQRNKRKTIEWERLEISSRKVEIPRDYFMQRHNKGQKEQGPNRSRRDKEEVAILHRSTVQKKVLMTQMITMV